MRRLHGFSYRKYQNIPKHALLHKGGAFEEDLVYPSADGNDRFSPARKVPSMTTAYGRHLADAAVMCEYIEDVYPEPALFSAEPWSRNRVAGSCKCRSFIWSLFAGACFSSVTAAPRHGRPSWRRSTASWTAASPA